MTFVGIFISHHSFAVVVESENGDHVKMQYTLQECFFEKCRVVGHLTKPHKTKINC